MKDPIDYFWERRLENIVAQVVRPVWASPSRKRTIEEELLIHVTTVFDEELDRLGDEEAAFQATRERFGVDGELGLQLQDCIPQLERWLLISEKEVLMSRWFWLIAVFAVFVGPAIELPALAKLRDHHELLLFPLALGASITCAGLVAVFYGIVKRFANST